MTENMTDVRDIIASMTAVFGKSKTLSVMKQTLRYMDLAEQEIEKAKVAHPDKKDVVHYSFRYLCCPEMLCGCPDLVYKIYVREIIERVINGEKDNEKGLGRTTDAELIWLLYNTSLDAPLSGDHAGLYLKLSTKSIFSGEDVSVPAWAQEWVDAASYQESYPGSIQEIEGVLRRKYASKKRSCTS